MSTRYLDINLNNLTVNKVTADEYRTLEKAGTLKSDEYYFVSPDALSIPNISTSTNNQILTNNGSSIKWTTLSTDINIITLSATFGTISLLPNKCYLGSISGNTTFNLSTPSNKNIFNQIKVMLKVTGSPIITWGTENYFYHEIPTISEGNYDIYFDYDNNISNWVVGVLPKGISE